MFKVADTICYKGYTGKIIFAKSNNKYLVELHNYKGHKIIHKQVDGYMLYRYDQIEIK